MKKLHKVISCFHQLKELMEATNAPLQAPTYGNLITILSIDGGGIRGVIPGTILSFLESELQVKLVAFVCISIVL